MARDIKHLCWKDIAGERDYHAAFIMGLPATGYHSEFHTHDFHEVMLILEGNGSHIINGVEVPLRARDLVLVRPHDCHAIATRSGQSLQFINIAWRSSLWQEFANFASFSAMLHQWETAPSSITVRVLRESFAECRRGFDQILNTFHQGIGLSSQSLAQTSRLELAAFWSLVISHLVGTTHTAEESSTHLPTDEIPVTMPAWLSQACRAMRDDNLQAGLPCFIELAGVTPEHLGRTLRACTGQTPTEWINARRLQQAALLLVTTPNSISDIAFDCGFSNVSYFHRLFRQRYHESPRSYRLQAGKAVAP
jgi:AraC-like DNA-binding protein/mannose-6-phosphate isomerase-like protein (cupin superfamily)